MKWPEEKIIEKPEPELTAEDAKATVLRIIQGDKDASEE